MNVKFVSGINVVLWKYVYKDELRNTACIDKIPDFDMKLTINIGKMLNYS